MATSAQIAWAPRGPAAWFLEFLKQELAPYPGRTGIVARMVIAATLIMIIVMVFRIPYGFQGAIYALLISRDSPRSTLESGGAIFAIAAMGAAYLLISAWFIISFPFLHFLWIIASFFLAFYALSTMTSYAASSTFAIIIAIGVPLWDRHVSAETNVADTLWLLLGLCIGVAVTAAVELAFARSRPEDNIILPVAERLAAVESLMACYAQGHPPDQTSEEEITRLALIGTSTLRRILRRNEYSPEYIAHMNGVVALVGRLVDSAAAMTQLSFQPSGADQKQLRNLAASVAGIRSDLINRRIPDPIEFIPHDESSHRVPLLLEMESLVALLPQTLAGSRSIDDDLRASDDIARSTLFAPRALVNPEHLKFALKGCLAASLCYIMYSATAWPGISTSVTTCLLTALSTIGSSRQKQVLRFGGAVMGGFVIGMGSQVFILPNLDSIGGFTLLFILVTIFASWIMTSSSRLSYFGLQVAVAFYLINLQEFAMQTSLAVARDRVVGVLLGLFMMWLVFDQLWSAPAAVEMKRTFISNLRLLAQFVGDPLPEREKNWSNYALRDTIEANFNKIRSLADGVLFEFGSTRQRDLALRDQIRRLQPRLQAIFLTGIALLKYRLGLRGFEFPKAAHAAQQEFTDHLATVLDGIADRMEGKEPGRQEGRKDAFENLERTVGSCFSKGQPQESLAAELQTFLALSRSIESLTMSVSKENL